ncbi:ARM repeat-containing protein [Metschnikowia bicuspidata var. bicuspidata NRRL YB-4993]|uniref:Nucleolar protein 9 n=1 Tax=Metschnikowia bicuspidata var. bicuspidata NRRL YB-4993 TaxID=869754 RepID=A0A1A0H232_9ASCO|nr:ARM repeat-containing protein [Metschnikowia bicuspidata var. bicuspidata NRRL YB-4993]OBA17982.1 ARM repeat-containing protein [Metschnikowia bicuspidata var. bicuspidata NRRL YB-4993]
MAKQRGRRQNNTYKERSSEQAKSGFGADIRTEAQQTQETGEEPKSEFSSVFYGLVDLNEIDYFKQAESTLNINAFDSDEERAGFIRSVLEECRGKELKLVTNQICSKLMERLVLYASDRQLKHIFHQFQDHFPALAHHKYSSHVLETLLVRSAALIEKELAHANHAEDEDLEAESGDAAEDKQVTSVPMEAMYIKMLALFAPYWSTMIVHQYASHVMRIILLVTSAKELPSTTMAHSVLRSKKSKIARKMIEIKDNEDFNRAYEVPASFKDELKRIIGAVTSPLDTKAARELAIHKIASPVLQLILRVEGIFDRDRPVWHLLFRLEKDDKDAAEEAFVEYLLSDSVGSHFLEAIIKNDGARMKYIERLYKLYMKARVLKLAKRATTGVYIIQALMLKLKPGEVEYILDEIIPDISGLVSISENQNIDLGKSVIEASMSRFNYRRDDLVQQLFKKFAPNYSPDEPSDDTTTEFFENVLQLTGSTLGNTRDDWPTAEERRRALFIEKLMEYDYGFVVCAWLNFMALSPEKFMQMCFHGVFSHVVEHALVVKPASEGEPKDIMIMRKKFLNIFMGHIFELSCNSYGSHIVDKLWNFTVLLPMYKDRIGSELMANLHRVKDSTYGRLVWKNWSMELFVRKKYDWKTLVKTQEQDYRASADEDTAGEQKKKPIELKMEQLYKQKQYQEEREKRKGEDLAYAEKKRQRMRGRDRY